MLKIFQTGDNHIGLKYSNHAQKEILISKRIDAFASMVQAANDESCDLFVITGDLFEKNTGIAKSTISTLMDTLSKFNGTVVVLPGNHDYYDKDKPVWKHFHELITAYDNILLLTEYRPYPIDVNDDRVVLYPAHCTTLHSEPGENNLGWIKETEIENDGCYHIGIAHGAVESKTPDDKKQYFFMTYDELNAIPVDAWLIGHTHVPFPDNLTEDFACVGKIFNAGTHVQTDVNCNTEGQCFILEIDEDKTVRAKKFVSGNIRFYRKNIALSAGEMEGILSRELAGIEDNSVVDLNLGGAVTAEEYENRHDIIEKVLSRFIEGTYNESELSKLISKELIESEFSETSFSAGFLTALLDNTKEAQLAYEMLQEIKGGKA